MSESKLEIPAKNHIGWKKLIQGESKILLENFVLRVRVAELIQEVKAGKTKEEDAIEEIHDLFMKSANTAGEDLKKIFK